MMKSILLATLIISNASCSSNHPIDIPIEKAIYTMPIESAAHEGTWLQWPQPYEYGYAYAKHLEPTWIAMTQELVRVGKVHIIAYDEKHKEEIADRLAANHIATNNIDYHLFKTNGVWIRDNGPIFVFDKKNSMYVEGWGFNGWGNKFKYNYDRQIPSEVAGSLELPYINLQKEMTIEGGAYEFNKQGTILLTESSVLNNDRNPGLKKEDAERILTTYLGVKNFIWMKGANVGITDMHVDGFARFTPDGNTIITMSKADLAYWELSDNDIDILYHAKNTDGNAFNYTWLPLTQNNVTTTYGKDLGIKASYVNYYITNNLVLVPIYNDPNDNIALEKIQNIYPERKVIGILAQNVYAEGGMIHCITQQQPLQ